MAVLFNVSTNIKEAAFKVRVLGERGNDREKRWRESSDTIFFHSEGSQAVPTQSSAKEKG
jgi:hypothetical protein